MNTRRLIGVATSMVLLLGISGCALLEGRERSDKDADVLPRKEAAGAVSNMPSPASMLPTEQRKPGGTTGQPEQDVPKLYPGTGNLVRTLPQLKAESKEPEEVSLNFEGVDIRTVVENIFTNYLREPYLIGPNLAGTVTLRTTRGIPKKELIPTLEMLLRQNGHALVREDGLYKIVPFNQVRGSLSPQLGGVTTALPQGFSVIVVPLKYIGAKAMQQLLEPFTTDASAVRADELRNLVILAGGQRELRHLLDTIDLFDVDFLAGFSVGVFPIKSVNVKELIADVDKIFGANASPLAGIVRVVPIERLNSLLIVTTQARYLEEAKKWIERLDQVSPRGGGLHVYHVKNGKAENLASLLTEIFGGAKSGSSASTPQLAPGARPAEIRSPTPLGATAAPVAGATAGAAGSAAQFQGDGVLVSKDVRVVADKDNNALLIIASQADYEKIESALKQLDVVPRQVLVEVMIAEVTLSDELRFGIDWFINARSGTSHPIGAGFSDRANNVTQGASNFGGSLPSDASGRPSAFAGLQLFNTLNGDIRGVLRAFSKDGKVQVLASPSVMVLDNQKASIKVGTKVSVTTGNQTTGTTSGVVTTISYLDTGVILNVTPRINASGQVTMEISQEVSVPGAAGVGGNPDVSTRSFQTSVTVNSGDTMALAGLIQRNRSSGGKGVPLLSKIPVLGAAFGQQEITDTKTELVVVITPQVVANATQAQSVTNELKRKLPGLEGLLQGGSRSQGR